MVDAESIIGGVYVTEGPTFVVDLEELSSLG